MEAFALLLECIGNAKETELLLKSYNITVPTVSNVTTTPLSPTAESQGAAQVPIVSPSPLKSLSEPEDLDERVKNAYALVKQD